MGLCKIDTLPTLRSSQDKLLWMPEELTFIDLSFNCLKKIDPVNLLDGLGMHAAAPLSSIHHSSNSPPPCPNRRQILLEYPKISILYLHGNEISSLKGMLWGRGGFDA